MSDQTASSRIEWRTEFETGDRAIDHEHKEMVERINGFLAAADAGVEAAALVGRLGEIHAWISAHFALEEKIMRDLGYDRFAQHKDDHETLLDEIRDLMDAIEADGHAGTDRRVQQRITDWFVDHFKTQDSRLHRVLRKLLI